MSFLGFKSVVFHGETCLGELETVQVKDQNFQFPNNEIRIHHISQNSERCHPLSVLQTISSPVRCKLEPNSNLASNGSDQSPLINLHASCFYELKTAVVLLGEEEIHLVAMPSKQKKFPCFWCYSVPFGLYSACLRMLNMRCLSIVFDLDETLIVANTMKSFEDRIEALRGWVARETDPIRLSGMSAEMKRYVEDRALLKQYLENDSVVDGGKVYKAQQEEVLQLSEGQERVVRPVIRLLEKNVVLTRINPENRDTSVLVRLRPAWDELRTYLTARGRRRFEVYVCTMAERDYALEIWRLLDPGSHLINAKQLMDRVVCVKSGSKKSLLTVFQTGNCHPKLAMVIDDRLKVWEDKDQPRVHVVPAFTPYYAPQAEMANAVPVLCVARNVACDVRGRFFKEFDESLLRKISEIFYEDEVVNLPSAPDVSNYLMSEDACFSSSGNLNAPIPEGMYGPEVAQRLHQQEGKVNMNSAPPFIGNNPDLKPGSSQLTVGIAANVPAQSMRPIQPSEKPSLLGAPFRRDNSFSEVDADGKRRYPMLNPSQDSRYRGSAEPPLLSRVPQKPPILPIPSQGGWLVEDDLNKGHLGSRSPGIFQESDASRSDKQRGHLNLLSQGATSMVLPTYASTGKNEEANSRHEMHKQNSLIQQTEGRLLQHQSTFNNRESQPEAGRMNFLPSLATGVLQEIGRRCNSKVEFRPVVSTSEELQFSVEVFFTGERVGVGMGKTRKDAQQQAAENALRNLADRYVSYITSHPRVVDKDLNKLSVENENGFLWETVDHVDEWSVEDRVPQVNVPEVGVNGNAAHD
ncbi:PREDICTED: RNA polymerase II C-terminal domain phosphatase-like 2 isoform X2 [Nicotiana attenuata]|uniref:protein-serine/threonine phosphatase n=1 Tax=Nicotiana attenuata TaxID=49451 RepID=A0A1J6L5K3_NICAT|nr:PREDICTED: RNA polymerase II C-terminal domain phosphatase-like 2 isoform X2 [Nicotiana attenuata]OIT26425.1 rna polymerase ii c-terminal domain phosphatase-like 2 [Nicotiana attenuata]